MLTTRSDVAANGSAGGTGRSGGTAAPLYGEAAALRQAVIGRVDAGQVVLPLLPQVAAQVVMLAGNPSVDAAQLSGLIHRDPALAGQVLRIANSPAYMPKMPIVSLQQAVARLGLNSVTEIAFVASVQSGTFKVKGFEAELGRLWRHAIASGVFAKEIARIRRSNVEAAFLCGLLHAVGKPALLQVVADEELKLAKAQLAAERTATGATRAALPVILDELHTGVGLRIAELWCLPRPVVNAIGTYATYDRQPTHTEEAMVTCLADRLATDLTEPARFDEATLRDHAVFAHLNLYPDDVAALRSKRAQVAEAVAAMTV